VLWPTEPPRETLWWDPRFGESAHELRRKGDLDSRSRLWRQVGSRVIVPGPQASTLAHDTHISDPRANSGVPSSGGYASRRMKAAPNEREGQMTAKTHRRIDLRVNRLLDLYNALHGGICRMSSRPGPCLGQAYGQIRLEPRCWSRLRRLQFVPFDQRQGPVTTLNHQSVRTLA
jgi:hypothetical protein